MAEKIRISIEIGSEFTDENYTALKAMLDAYIGEYIKINKQPTSNQPFGNRNFNNELNFIVTFLKSEPTLEYQA